MRHGLAALTAGLLLLPACGYTPEALGDWRDDPSCGSFENRNHPPSEQQREATRCLLDAFADGRPAELVATFHTIEGAPITEYYRVLGPGRVEVFLDATADNDGSQRWSHSVCGGLGQEGTYLYHEDCRALSVDEVVTQGYG